MATLTRILLFLVPLLGLTSCRSQLPLKEVKLPPLFHTSPILTHILGRKNILPLPMNQTRPTNQTLKQSLNVTLKKNAKKPIASLPSTRNRRNAFFGVPGLQFPKLPAGFDSVLNGNNALQNGPLSGNSLLQSVMNSMPKAPGPNPQGPPAPAAPAAAAQPVVQAPANPAALEAPAPASVPAPVSDQAPIPASVPAAVPPVAPTPVPSVFPQFPQANFSLSQLFPNLSTPLNLPNLTQILPKIPAYPFPIPALPTLTSPLATLMAPIQSLQSNLQALQLLAIFQQSLFNASTGILKPWAHFHNQLSVTASTLPGLFAANGALVGSTIAAPVHLYANLMNSLAKMLNPMSLLSVPNVAAPGSLLSSFGAGEVPAVLSRVARSVPEGPAAAAVPKIPKAFLALPEPVLKALTGNVRRLAREIIKLGDSMKKAGQGVSKIGNKIIEAGQKEVAKWNTQISPKSAEEIESDVSETVAETTTTLATTFPETTPSTELATEPEVVQGLIESSPGVFTLASKSKTESESAQN